MRKVKVRILQSIAGMGDPKPKEELELKYEKKIAELNKGRRKPFDDVTVRLLKEEWRLSDRAGEKPLGFSGDFSFKPGDEPMLLEDLAKKWEESGTCVIIRETKQAA